MKKSERQTRSYLMKLFEQHGFHPRSDLGQNFLIDLNLIDFIVREAQIHSHDVVLEIGAGTGSLTTALAQQAAAVITVEYDTRMCEIVRMAAAPFDNITLIEGDVLKNKNHFMPHVLETVRSALDQDPQRRLKLVSNLPYNVATPVVSNLVATDLPWTRMVVTIQWELAMRMAAEPGSSHYGALSVWLQSQCFAAILRKLGPTVFWPRPKVDSAIICLIPDSDKQRLIVDRRFFQDFVRRLFHHRRKFLRRVVVGMYSKQLSKPDVDAMLASMGLAESVRAETIDPATLVEMANRLRAAIAAAGTAEQEQQASSRIEL